MDNWLKKGNYLDVPAMQNTVNCIILANLMADTKERIRTHTIYYDEIQHVTDGTVKDLLNFIKWYISDFWDLQEFYNSSMYTSFYMYIWKFFKSWDIDQETLKNICEKVWLDISQLPLPSSPRYSKYTLDLEIKERTFDEEKNTQENIEETIQRNKWHMYFFMWTQSKDHELMKQCLSHFQQALDLNQEEGINYYNMMVIHRKLWNMKEAIQYWESAIVIESEEIIYRKMLVRACMDYKDFNTAIVHLKKMLAEFPPNDMFYAYLARCYENIWDDKKVMNILRKWIWKLPNSAHLQYLIWEQHLWQKKYVLAEKKFRKALELNPQDSHYWYTLWVLCCQTIKGKREEWKWYIDKAIELAPENTMYQKARQTIDLWNLFWDGTSWIIVVG